ncbi:MAG: leucine-rich repeat domain-containing protein [Clostridia bacterium]|nr:leucine-rich repeat domain-containing protein [Clostridia bacterium]
MLEIIKCTACGGDIAETEVGVYKCLSCGRIYRSTDEIKPDNAFDIEDEVLLKKYRGRERVVKVPDCVRAIGSGAFENNNFVEKVILPERLFEIYDSAFCGCRNLESVEFNGSCLEYVNEDAFEGCESLHRVCITDLDSWLGIFFDEETAYPLYCGGDLYLNGELLTDVAVPDGLKSVRAFVFMGCRSLQSVTIAGSVTEIELCAFERCVSLKNVIIPEGVVEIGNCAFQGCTGLGYVVLPKSLKTVGYEAFYGCSALKSVFYGGSESEWYHIKMWGSFEKNSTVEDPLTTAKKYFYSETRPAVYAYRYWHYVEDTPVPWAEG